MKGSLSLLKLSSVPNLTETILKGEISRDEMINKGMMQVLIQMSSSEFSSDMLTHLKMILKECGRHTFSLVKI